MYKFILLFAVFAVAFAGECFEKYIFPNNRGFDSGKLESFSN